jgi:hypothetical protein
MPLPGYTNIARHKIPNPQGKTTLSLEETVSIPHLSPPAEIPQILLLKASSQKMPSPTFASAPKDSILHGQKSK